jgi:hypothetical protein
MATVLPIHDAILSEQGKQLVDGVLTAILTGPFTTDRHTVHQRTTESGSSSGQIRSFLASWLRSPTVRRESLNPRQSAERGPIDRLRGMLTLITRAWLTCAEWGRLAMQAFGGGNGDPDALRALDEANKNALPSDGAGSAQQAFSDRQRLDGRKDNSDIA